MLRLGKLKIHWSFFFFMILTVSLGQIKLFLFLFSATTIHELSHILIAKLLRLPLESLIITAVGEAAVVEGFEALPSIKKYAVLLAGPLVNIILFVILLSFYKASGEGSVSFAQINLAIGLFNLLPIYPFDGGKLALVLIGNKIGVIRAVGMLKLITRIGICAMFFFGFIQLVLFPFNISLIAIGAFLISIYEREKSYLSFSYYRCMLNKSKRLKAGLMVKSAVFPSETPSGEAEQVFTWDYYHIIHLEEGGKIIASLTEAQIFESGLSRLGSKTKLLDIIGHYDI